MKIAALLLALAACWTGAAPVVEPPRTARRVRVKPQCWSTEFYEQWPAEASFHAINLACYEQWQGDPGDVGNCVGAEMWRAYDQLWMWTQRWFESCDPERRP